MSAIAIAIGQRWRYQAGGLDFIMEVQEGRRDIGTGFCKGLVLQGNYNPGSTHDFNPFPQDTTGSRVWYYLEGQDKPK